jgi:hypothetical protein
VQPTRLPALNEEAQNSRIGIILQELPLLSGSDRMELLDLVEEVEVEVVADLNVGLDARLKFINLLKSYITLIQLFQPGCVLPLHII